MCTHKILTVIKLTSRSQSNKRYIWRSECRHEVIVVLRCNGEVVDCITGEPTQHIAPVLVYAMIGRCIVDSCKLNFEKNKL